jgi:hypothetical protein
VGLFLGVDPSTLLALLSGNETRGHGYVLADHEQRRIHHVGAFPTLEDQMCAFAPDFDRASAGFSPDRVDALVWAFADLLVEQMSNEGFYLWVKEKAASLQPKPAPRPEPIYAIGGPRIRGAAGAPETAVPGTGRGRLMVGFNHSATGAGRCRKRRGCGSHQQTSAIVLTNKTRVGSSAGSFLGGKPT